jgi:hypothetical protein
VCDEYQKRVLCRFLDEGGDTRSQLGIKRRKRLVKKEQIAAVGKRARKGKTMAVTNWYTKLQHVLFKLLPDRILTILWRKTVLKIK